MTDTDGRGAPSSAAVARLRLVIARLYRQLAQASSDDLNLTYAQLSALARIEQHGPLRLGELAAHEQVAAPSMTRTVTPLAAAGLIVKEPDPTDGRSWLVTVTPEGSDALDRIRRTRSELLARRMAALDAGRLDALLEALPALEELLTEPGQEPEHEAGHERGHAPEQDPAPRAAPAADRDAGQGRLAGRPARR